MRDRSITVVSVALALVVTACSAPVTTTCEPGRSITCAGSGGCVGSQVCTPDGSGWGECRCAGPDGGADAGRDAGADAGSVDAAVSMDGAPLDGSVGDAGELDAATSDAAVDDGAVDALVVDAAMDLDVGADAGDDAAAADAGSDAGTCSPACSIDEQCCASTCIATTTVGMDPTASPAFRNCGGCGIACSIDTADGCTISGSSSAPRCTCGLLDACGPGTACVVNGVGPICTDLSSDPGNCGTRGHTCRPSETCVAGSCRCGTGAGCATGEACCGGSCVGIVSDVNNCGGCGVTCGASGDRCIGGSCHCGAFGSPCPVPGTAGAPLGESCCGATCVPNDDAHCGNCSTTCSGADHCLYSSGGLGLPPRGDCCGTTVSGIPVCR